MKSLEVKKVSEALDRPNITMLKKVLDPIVIETFMAAQLTEIIKQINVDPRLNIQKSQVPLIVDMLIEKYPVETVEDISLCLRRGAIGYYGSIYRLDAAVINEWMGQYLEEKYQIVESQVKKEKNALDEISEHAPEILTELRKKLNKQFIPGEMKIVLENKQIPRPEWIVGDTCDQCGGTGMAGPSPQEQFECTHCEGTGETNRVKVHASSPEEARKAYNVFKKQ